MTAIKLRLAAQCEAAGRTENEDNYLISENLSEGKWGFITDNEIELSKMGILLVVADGMGGANAGEVASALAVESIREWFLPENLKKESFLYPSDIKSYIKKAIQAADQKIKKQGIKNKETAGMGSTIVLTWILGNRAYVGWCGDSRCYRYNNTDGLVQLSHDHSYVQELVDKGKLVSELAFDFPDRNIITRSLGDPRRKANPDVTDFPLQNGDILLLCSDGLSGVLHDYEMEEVIRANTESLKACRDTLWETSREAEWEDNVTLVLCRIVSGIEPEKSGSTVKIESKNKDGENKEEESGEKIASDEEPEKDGNEEGKDVAEKKETVDKEEKKEVKVQSEIKSEKKKRLVVLIVSIIIILMAIVATLYYYSFILKWLS